MAWGDKWPEINIGSNKMVWPDHNSKIEWVGIKKPNEAADAKLLNDVLMQDGAIHPAKIDSVAPDLIWVEPEPNFWNGDATIKSIRKLLNKVPTHDPYTNPNAHIYYECNCGQILDPGTKRFAELNNCASRAGWKIRFSDNGYIPYCVECGKGVE